MIFVLIGVCGSGKSTIGKELAHRLKWLFVDADDFHSDENRSKLAAGIALTDRDREGWLGAIREKMLECQTSGVDVILACSALKEQYRSHLQSGLLAKAVQFIYLEGSRFLLAARLKGREHAFMNQNLLDSQLATLEVPAYAWRISIQGAPEAICDEIIGYMDTSGY